MPISDSGQPKNVQALSLDMMGKLVYQQQMRLPLTEDDVAFLLRFFGYNPARTEQERYEQIEDTITADDSLKWAALHYGKDPRTIREWCKLGFFPSAYRTPGKHWRIPFGAIKEAEKHLPDFARKPKTLLGSKEWAQLKPRLKNIPKGVKAAFEVNAAMQDLGSVEIRKGRPKVSTAAVGAMLLAYEKGNPPHLRLLLAARRLYARDPTKPITRQMLARETGVSTATLYRHYGAKKIWEVVCEAKHPLKFEDVGTETLEASSEVASMFAEYESF